MSLSIFDDEDLVEALGYSREWHGATSRSAVYLREDASFYVRDRDLDRERERSAAWYRRIKSNPELHRSYVARKHAERCARNGTEPNPARWCSVCGVLVRRGGQPLRFCERCRLDEDSRRQRERRARAAAQDGRELRAYTGRDPSRRWVTARRAA